MDAVISAPVNFMKTYAIDTGTTTTRTSEKKWMTGRSNRATGENLNSEAYPRPRSNWGVKKWVKFEASGSS